MVVKKHKGSHGYMKVNIVRLIQGGSDYFSLLLDLINKAKESIHLQSYIYDDDETGSLVADALKKASQRKVEVYVLVDGYASQSLSRPFIKELEKAGIRFRFFAPFFKGSNFYFGRRMHHKVTVIDAKYALVGGVNIADRYNDLPGKPAWLDFALYVEGEIAKELCVLCWKAWQGYPRRMEITPCEKNIVPFTIAVDKTSSVRVRRNDWVRRKNEISASYIHLFRTAQDSVTVLCSYFLPGKIMRRQIRFALGRGVKIRIIAAGISDVWLAKNAERWLYDWLLRNKIELYEYQRNVLHGKLAVCDDRWMTTGSYNINDISAFASIELNLDVDDPRFAAEVRKKMDEIIANDCIRVTPESIAKTKNILKQFIRWSSYQFIRLVFHLFTFYFKRAN